MYHHGRRTIHLLLRFKNGTGERSGPCPRRAPPALHTRTLPGPGPETPRFAREGTRKGPSNNQSESSGSPQTVTSTAHTHVLHSSGSHRCNKGVTSCCRRTTIHTQSASTQDKHFPRGSGTRPKGHRTKSASLNVPNSSDAATSRNLAQS